MTIVSNVIIWFYHNRLYLNHSIAIFFAIFYKLDGIRIPIIPLAILLDWLGKSDMLAVREVHDELLLLLLLLLLLVAEEEVVKVVVILLALEI